MKLLTIIGARPQFIKAAVVSREIAKRNKNGSGASTLKEIIVHTGQHFDANMSQVFFDELEIPQPGYHLGVGGGSHGQNTGRMLEKIEEVMVTEKPDRVLVYGDTDSTLAGALAAVKLHIPVAHVEAGLRSFNRRMPEEINRVLTDHIADRLYVPTVTAQNNLANEGIIGRGVVISGDVMLDAARYYAKRIDHDIDSRLSRFNVANKQFVLATIHRAENTDNPARLKEIITSLLRLAEKTAVVLPMHPRTRSRLGSIYPELASCDNQQSTTIGKQLLVVPPIGYFDMIALERSANCIITDSGGVQKEAFFHATPCITLRAETEWVELVHGGYNILAATDADLTTLVAEMSSRPHNWNNPLYGKGNAATIIVDDLVG